MDTSIKPKRRELTINSILSIMVVGVGGQGVITLGKFFRGYALSCPEIADMISIETRGVSQREGSVTTTIRYLLKDNNNTERVSLSPKPLAQTIHIMFAMEPLEFLRNLHFLHPSALVILNSQENIPKSSVKLLNYPPIAERLLILSKTYPDLTLITKNFTDLACADDGKSYLTNQFLLSEFLEHLPLGQELSDRWEFPSLTKIFPKKGMKKAIESFFQR